MASQVKMIGNHFLPFSSAEADIFLGEFTIECKGVNGKYGGDVVDNGVDNQVYDIKALKKQSKVNPGMRELQNKTMHSRKPGTYFNEGKD